MDNETGTLTVRERLLDHFDENVAEIDYLSRGDFLELLDLENPPSRSSCSSDSSCVTMSSDEYFDTLALLQDIESEKNNDGVQKDAGCKFSVTASVKPTEVRMHPAFSGKSKNLSHFPCFFCSMCAHFFYDVRIF